MFDLGEAQVRVRGDDHDDRPMRWLEATYKASDGRLYGWYHEEPVDVCSNRTTCRRRPTVPRIGAMSSDDEGSAGAISGPSWRPRAGLAGARRPTTSSPPASRRFLRDSRPEGRSTCYFVFSSYGPAPDQQGIGLARISRGDSTRRWGSLALRGAMRAGGAGTGGRGAMLIPAMTRLASGPTQRVWGPTVHWNTYLNRYVFLLNRASNARWSQVGAYAAFAGNLDEPLPGPSPRSSATAGTGTFQAIGTDAGRRETDTPSVGPRATSSMACRATAPVFHPARRVAVRGSTSPPSPPGGRQVQG